jgi:hypothetical protein
VKVALLLRVRRGILAGEDAYEANVVRPIAQDFEGLHEPGQPVALDAHLFLDLGRSLRRPGLLDGNRRLRCGLSWRALGRPGLGAADSGCLSRDLHSFHAGLTLGGPGRLLHGWRFGRDGSGLRGRGLGAGLNGRGRLGGGLIYQNLPNFLNLLPSLGRGFGGRPLARRGRRCGNRTVGAANQRRLAQDGAGELGDGLHGPSI